MAVPKHPNTTRGSLSVDRSETAWRYRRKALKSVRRQGKVQTQEGLNQYQLGRELADMTRTFLIRSLFD